jgi:hypothetical protein
MADGSGLIVGRGGLVEEEDVASNVVGRSVGRVVKLGGIGSELEEDHVGLRRRKERGRERENPTLFD